MAQESAVKALFEKHDLMGTFAMDCSSPASKTNVYFVNRLLDANHMQLDKMIGPSDRDWIVIVDNVKELTSDEISLSGTLDGVPTDAVWRLERNRIRTVDTRRQEDEFRGQFDWRWTRHGVAQ
jgi:hypothetical protein